LTYIYTNIYTYIGSLSTFLIDWLASDWCINTHENKNENKNKNKTENETEKVLPIECQALPYLLKTITLLLKHATPNSLSSKLPSHGNIDDMRDRGAKNEDWIWFLYASGTVSSLSKGIFYYLYVDSLIYAFGWSAFLSRIRFCDTVVIIFFK
jgi:hypothetical protein